MTERKTIYLDDAMLKIAKVDKNKYADMSDFHDACVDCLKNLPSAQPERKTGLWILECDAEGEGDNLYRCPECGCNYSCQEYDIPNFCPNCGSYNGGGQSD